MHKGLPALILIVVALIAQHAHAQTTQTEAYALRLQAEQRLTSVELDYLVKESDLDEVTARLDAYRPFDPCDPNLSYLIDANTNWIGMSSSLAVAKTHRDALAAEYANVVIEYNVGNYDKVRDIVEGFFIGDDFILGTFAFAELEYLAAAFDVNAAGEYCTQYLDFYDMASQ